MQKGSLPTKPAQGKRGPKTPEELLEQIITIVSDTLGDRLQRTYYGPLIELAIMGADPEIPEPLRIQANAKAADFIYARHTIAKDDPKNRPFTLQLVQFSGSNPEPTSLGIVIDGENHAIERTRDT